MQTTPQSKLPKTQFNCFHCREATLRKDGRWFDWNDMQVHLCPRCDKDTQGRPERTKAR